MRLEEIVSLPEGPRRTAGLAAWLQSLYQGRESVPVLVGGGAVELYTGGAYTTGDMDFAGTVPPAVGRRLRESGFTPAGRHWIHEEHRLFLEFPSATLAEHEEKALFREGNLEILIISPEDLLIDRLASWKFWHYAPDGVNAFLLWRARGDNLDQSRVRSAARREEVEDALDALMKLFQRFPGGVVPAEELEEWARGEG